MRAILDVVMIALNFYTWIIVGSAVFSWLYHFNVINPRNQVVSTIGNMLYQLTEPLLSRIRPLLPTPGGLDLSPIVLLLGVFLLQSIIVRYVYPIVF